MWPRIYSSNLQSDARDIQGCPFRYAPGLGPSVRRCYSSKLTTFFHLFSPTYMRIFFCHSPFSPGEGGAWNLRLSSRNGSNIIFLHVSSPLAHDIRRSFFLSFWFRLGDSMIWHWERISIGQRRPSNFTFPSIQCFVFPVFFFLSSSLCTIYHTTAPRDVYMDIS